MTNPSLSRNGRGAALATLLLGVGACAPAANTPQGTAATTPAASAAPVLISCPAGQQPLLRQVAVNGALVPQVECIAAPTAAVAPAAAPQFGQPTFVPQAPATAYAAPAGYVPAPVYQPVAAAPVRVATRAGRPAARRVVYADDEYDELRAKPRRSWKKSALIIGSSAGIGAGVGAATGGKKGALIGAAIGGGAATVWDQVTRR